ncbi:helix-turn-helix domain-containing protein [Streptomyces sp. NPDC095817]|uniref:helix-turn-helix transcriptional regulator n=1 Tax=Streptomyces sp. NPDC095817 TaxID=3155082 RepID=UPI0033232EDC
MAADTYAQLAETLERLTHATEQTGRLSDVLDVEDLSHQTGITSDVVAALLDGGHAPETSVTDRVRQRLEFLRASRLRDDGNRYSQGDLAKIAGVSRQTLAAWFDSGVPNLESADRLRRFFGLSAGFLTADEPEALNDALQPKLQELEAQSDPLAPLRTPGFLRLARRAPHMSAKKLEALEQWAEAVTERD